MTFGLAAEADAIISARKGKGTITAVAVGQDFEGSLAQLGSYGVNRVFQFKGNAAKSYQGGYYAGTLAEFMETARPFVFLTAHTDQTADLPPGLRPLKALVW